MFRSIIRVVFIFAYGAFLYASLRHIAYFFHSFEPAYTDWTGSYALAISIDVTALILTIGIMFFRKGMSGWALAGIWLFILGLTAFSWIVNWEYATQFQSQDLNRAADFYWLNPILASAFAFLNLAYSIVAELFNSKSESAEELKQRNDETEAKLTEKVRKSDLKKHSILTSISDIKEVAKAAFQEPKLRQELKQKPEENLPEISPGFEMEELTNEIGFSSLDMASQVTRPQKYLVTFEEAAHITGYAISTLKQQLKAGEIEANVKGDKLKISTLKIKPGYSIQPPALLFVQDQERKIS